MCNSTRSSTAAWIVGGLLVAAVIAVFGQTLQHGFVNYDDKLYLLENQENVAGGLNSHSVAWAFRTAHGSLWGPLTWLSHLTDCHIYGMQSWGHHLTNVLLHCLTTVLLFWTIWRMTGDLWPSALTAALFAVHPLHVETVAWIAERKGLLGGLFFVATLAAYLRFVRKPFSWANYLLVIALFVMGLLSKPVGVTLPFLLLLLDYWPLGRMTSGLSRRLIVEKLPLVVFSAAACVAAPLTQGASVASLAEVTVGHRISSSVIAYVAYIEQFVWPVRLAPLYARDSHCPPIWQTLAAATVLLAISAAAVFGRKRASWFFVGWFWFFGTLVPMIGLVPLRNHYMADRYSYVTQIGLYVIVAWALARLVVAWPSMRTLCASVATAAILMLAAVAWLQTTHWRNTKALWTHVRQCYPQATVAIDGLAMAAFDEGRLDEARLCFQAALDADPNDVIALAQLGNIAATRGKYAEAANYLGRAVRAAPSHIPALHNYALVLLRLGKEPEALAVLRKALCEKPDSTIINNSLGSLLAARGELDAAASCFRRSLATDARNNEARNNLGMVLQDQGRISEAMAIWQETVRLDPHDTFAVGHLAWAMATGRDAKVRNAAVAIELARWEVQLTKGSEPTALRTLAAAYAEAGRFSDALKCADRAIVIAEARHETDAVRTLRDQREGYRQGKPHRE